MDAILTLLTRAALAFVLVSMALFIRHQLKDALESGVLGGGGVIIRRERDPSGFGLGLIGYRWLGLLLMILAAIVSAAPLA